MAFGVDTTSHATPLINEPSPFQITHPHTCGASANKLVAFPAAGVDGVSNFSGVTYNGIALSLVAAAEDGTFNVQEIWRLNNPATGAAFNIVATYAGAADLCNSAISFNDAAAADGTPNTNTGTGANPSVTVVDSASGNIVVSAIYNDVGPDSATTEAGTLIAEDEDVDNDCDYNVQRQVATGASTVCSWTAAAPSAGGWAAIGVAIKSGAVEAPLKYHPLDSVNYF